MEKLQKYCLSLLLVLVHFACKEKEPKQTVGQIAAQAEKVYKKAIEYPQGSPECMNLIEEAIRIDSTYAEAIRELSIAYLKRGIPHKWKPIIDKAVHYNPRTWQPVRGTAYLKVYRDYEKAIADFNATDTITPSFIDYTGGHSVDYWRAIAYLGLKDYKNCIYYFDKHIKKETEETGEDWVEINAFLYRGIAYFESGNTTKALENFEKIIYHFKNSADAEYYIALILNQKKVYKKAKSHIQKAKLDFKKGFYNNGVYVEPLRQIYWEDLEELSKIIGN